MEELAYWQGQEKISILSKGRKYSKSASNWYSKRAQKPPDKRMTSDNLDFEK